MVESETPEVVSLSVVCPTYREAENLPLLIERLAEVRRRHAGPLELIIVDDDSRDGGAAVVEALGHDWVRWVPRRGPRCLARSVVAGIGASGGDVIVVMDADLSHPAEAIPAMLAALPEADFVIGSRHVPGGTIDGDWGVERRLLSRLAAFLARPLTPVPVTDPMSGYFLVRRSTVEAARSLRPIGYKIGLELLVKAPILRVAEVPIHFADRRHGASKLTWWEQVRYLRHLRRLYAHRYLGIG